MVLNDDHTGQSHLYNLILRAYYLNNQFANMNDFVSKTDYALGSTENTAKYNFYLGVCSCISQSYSQANSYFLNSLSKTSAKNVGYRVLNLKWKLLTELLLGIIPEKKTFHE